VRRRNGAAEKLIPPSRQPVSSTAAGQIPQRYRNVVNEIELCSKACSISSLFPLWRDAPGRTWSPPFCGTDRDAPGTIDKFLDAYHKLTVTEPLFLQIFMKGDVESHKEQLSQSDEFFAYGKRVTRF
jgi:hypothetical protein